MGKPAGALVFLHGHYGLKEDFLPFLDKVDPERRLHGLLPHGPVPLSEGRASWFDFEVEDPFAALAPALAWLDGLPYPIERTILGGWSQGAMVAYAAALAHGRSRPAALLALGGNYEDLEHGGHWRPDLGRPLPPVFIGHGAADEVCPVEQARRTAARLEAAGGDVVYRESAVGHVIGQDSMPELRAFVAHVLPP